MVVDEVLNSDIAIICRKMRQRCGKDAEDLRNKARGRRFTAIALTDREFLASSATSKASLQKGVRATVRCGLGLPARRRVLFDRGKTAVDDLAKPAPLMAGNAVLRSLAVEPAVRGHLVARAGVPREAMALAVAGVEVGAGTEQQRGEDRPTHQMAPSASRRRQCFSAWSGGSLASSCTSGCFGLRVGGFAACWRGLCVQS